jgi:hypothetical protein
MYNFTDYRVVVFLPPFLEYETGRWIHDMNKRYPCFLPIPALIVIIVAMFLIVQPSIYYDPLRLNPITNTLFIAATGLCAAGLSPIYPLNFKKEQR